MKCLITRWGVMLMPTLSRPCLPQPEGRGYENFLKDSNTALPQLFPKPHHTQR